jgi:hypothetical protein
MKEVTSKKLNAAIQTIALFFTDEVKDKDGELVNQLEYVQRQVLDVLMWKAQNMIEKTDFNRAKANVVRARREHRGDEISEQNLRGRIEWYRRLELQVVHLEEFKKVVEKAGYAILGERLYPAAPAVNSPTARTDAMAEADAILGKKRAPAQDFNSTLGEEEAA